MVSLQDIAWVDCQDEGEHTMIPACPGKRPCRRTNSRTVQRQDRTPRLTGELEDFLIRDAAVGLAGFEGRQHVVAEPTKGFDGREREVLVRVERGHELRGLVLPGLRQKV